MSVCVFFGHRDCYGLDEEKLRWEIEAQIAEGTDVFYVGNQGQFDGAVRSALKSAKNKYPHIQYFVVLAYLPEKKEEYSDYTDTVYPEGLEYGHRKFAIAKRNRWMLHRADRCICYICHTWGGAYTAVKAAQKKGIEIKNLGTVEF